MNTLIVVADGLMRYIGWWLSALVRWRDPRAPMGARRLIALILGMPLGLVVQLVHAAALVLDEVLFPRYRRASLDGTLIITGIPRSGTTFLHRRLAEDTTTYTSITTWEALLAPSLLQRYLVRGLARLDRLTGRPAGRLLSRATRALTGSLDAIHEVGLETAEEDYLCLLPAAGCFIMLLAFPSATGLRALGCLSRDMPARRRQRLLRFYRGCLQRHIHADRGQRRLLSKNAAFGSWLGHLHETVPEARFILCIREPAQALSSQISSLHAAQRLFGTATEAASFQAIFLTMYEYTLADLAHVVAAWPTDRAAIVDMMELRTAPGATIGSALARLGVVPGDVLRAMLASLQGGGTSAHHHSVHDLALDTTSLDHRMRPSYHRLLALPHRIRGQP